MSEVSIIIVNYNTLDITLEAIASIEKSYPKEVIHGEYEVIVVDNASEGGSLRALQDYQKKTKIKSFHIVDTKKNVGFAAGNNKGILFAKGRYVLFLNPDTIMYPRTLPTLVEFMDTHQDAGAVTCQVNIPNGQIDQASHRGFPTPWNAFTHFSGLEKLFPHSKLFAGYTQGWEDMKKIHTVPAVVGAFLLTRREAGEQIGWWDEDYFFYGEDLDFCYMLYEKGWKIYYVPRVSILHYGGVSSGIKKHSQHITTADTKRREMVQYHRFEAMKIFYKKHYLQTYPKLVTWLVFKGIEYLHWKNTSK